MTSVYIGLGSNLEDPARQLRQASHAIADLPDSALMACSQVYRSAPVGPGDQPDYLNAVLCLDTALPPLSLLAALQRIEAAQGRERVVRWGARTLDLDILLYGDLQYASAVLTLPHPRMRERPFVLRPLLDICDKKMVLPSGEEVGTLLTACEGTAELTGLSLGMENTEHVENQS